LNGGDFILAVVGVVNWLCLGANPQALRLPLYFHLNKYRIDPFQSYQVYHTDLLELILK
jgi:hypothetical protein